MIIAIDGPAGTGKTTIARRLAQKLHFHYFDTGALYRALTYQILREGIAIEEGAALEALLTCLRFQVKEGHYYVQGKEVTEEIRSPEVTAHVSAVAALRSVRAFLIEIQRAFAEGKSAVFEGRDLGTVVFPNADLKVFLTARVEVRAHRRYGELKERGVEITVGEVEKQIEERDRLDSEREIAPLKQADDAHLIDTSTLSIDAVVAQIETLLQQTS